MKHACNNLEKILCRNIDDNFKSKGEIKIADFLDEMGIKYLYEQGILVEDYQQKQRIWYPDFYLPEFGMYIEYFGVVNDRDYEKGIHKKNAVYKKMTLDVIGIYPYMFKENWKKYIIGSIGQKVERQYDRFLDLQSQYLKEDYILKSDFLDPLL